jgi:hypothetical protein
MQERQHCEPRGQQYYGARFGRDQSDVVQTSHTVGRVGGIQELDGRRIAGTFKFDRIRLPVHQKEGSWIGTHLAAKGIGKNTVIIASDHKIKGARTAINRLTREQKRIGHFADGKRKPVSGALNCVHGLLNSARQSVPAPRQVDEVIPILGRERADSVVGNFKVRIEWLVCLAHHS